MGLDGSAAASSLPNWASHKPHASTCSRTRTACSAVRVPSWKATRSSALGHGPRRSRSSLTPGFSHSEKECSFGSGGGTSLIPLALHRLPGQQEVPPAILQTGLHLLLRKAGCFCYFLGSVTFDIEEL